MAKHEDFYPLLLPAVPGCPYPTVDFALTRAAIDFCDQTRAWEEEADPIVLGRNTAQYDLDPPADSVVVCVQSATIDGAPLVLAKSIAELSGLMSRNDRPSAIASDGVTVTVAPVPDAASVGAVIRLRCTLRPTFAPRTLPDVLLKRHMDVICEGAKAHLKAMSGTGWFDPAGAAVANQLFMTAAAKARINVEHGFVSGSLSARPRRYGYG